MRLLGIDPGLSATGYGFIINNSKFYTGTIRPREKVYIQKILTICKEIERLIRLYKPDAVAIEKVFYQKNVASLVRISELRGALLYLLLKKRITILEYTPAQIKLTTTGNGQASKRQVRFVIERVLLKNRTRLSHHAIDALAIAYTAARKMG